jgi:Lar family restriction alleviation protein
MEPELKPCPFCGSTAAPALMGGAEISCYAEDRNDYAVCCRFLKGGCGATGYYDFDKQKAVKAWNRRAVSATESQSG